MFNKKQEIRRPQYEKFETLVGPTTMVEGTIKTQEPLRIDGRVQGEVISKADLILGEKSHIAGNITCQNLLLAGTVQGNVTVTGQLHITSTGRLMGDATIGAFIVDERGIFEGACTMIQGSVSEEDASPDGEEDNQPQARNNRRKK